MAVDNIKDFSIQWASFGLLFFSLLTFAIGFIAYNSPGSLGDSGNNLNSYASGIEGKLVLVEGDSNSLLNISSQNNPEVSDLGSKESVAVSYGIIGSSRSFFEESKSFFGWIFSGTSGQILISVFAGMFGLTALYFITKYVRQGQ